MFLARAVFHITRVGWLRCWQQRHIEIEDQSLAVLTNMDEGDPTDHEPVGESVGVNNDVLTDEVMDNNEN